MDYLSVQRIMSMVSQHGISFLDIWSSCVITLDKLTYRSSEFDLPHIHFCFIHDNLYILDRRFPKVPQFLPKCSIVIHSCAISPRRTANYLRHKPSEFVEEKCWPCLLFFNPLRWMIFYLGCQLDSFLTLCSALITEQGLAYSFTMLSCRCDLIV